MRVSPYQPRRKEGGKEGLLASSLPFLQTGLEVPPGSDGTFGRAKRGGRKGGERAFKLLNLFCSLVRSARMVVKEAAYKGWKRESGGILRGQGGQLGKRGRKGALKPTEPDDVAAVFSKEGRKEAETISGRAE